MKLVIAGDFNTPNRSDDSLKTLSNVVTDVNQPADQAGDKDTNLTRAYPYDYVLPNPLFNSCQVPLTLGGFVFPNGVVFDSRVWNPPPAPVQTNDSAGTDMQHLAVMKQFALLTCTDCDDDTLPDSWEIGYFGALTNVSAHSDWDHDGFPDSHEYLAGTHPTNGNSLLRMETASSGESQAFRVGWSSVTGKRYDVMRSTNLMTGFATLQSGVSAVSATTSFTDAPPAGTPLYYRVRLAP